jgi:hypothetical protein
MYRIDSFIHSYVRSFVRTFVPENGSLSCHRRTRHDSSSQQSTHPFRTTFRTFKTTFKTTFRTTVETFPPRKQAAGDAGERNGIEPCLAWLGLALAVRELPPSLLVPIQSNPIQSNPIDSNAVYIIMF